MDVNFGTTLAMDMLNPNKRPIVFTNNIWQYSDSLTITDFMVNPAGSIDPTYVAYGTQGFTYNKTAILDPNNNPTQLPITIQPGQSITIPAAFVAPANGAFAASLTSVSDAQTDMASNLTGNGLIQGIEVDGGSVTTCIGGQAVITAFIRNTGTGIITINNVKINQTGNAFTLVNPWMGSQNLFAGQFDTIQVLFNPGNTPGTFMAYLEADNNTPDNPSATITLTGMSEKFLTDNKYKNHRFRN